MARLHGITMGLDVCATLHMGIGPAELRELTARVVRRGAPAYPDGRCREPDPMLGYLTTSFREHSVLRSETGRGHQSNGAAVVGWGSNGRRPNRGRGADVCALREGWWRLAQSAELEADGRRKVAGTGDRGLDVAGTQPRASLGSTAYTSTPGARCAPISRALFSAILRTLSCCSHQGRRSRRLHHTSTGGECLREEDDARRCGAAGRGGRHQIVVSDGLNATRSMNSFVRCCTAVRRLLTQDGHRVADPVVVNSQRTCPCRIPRRSLVDPGGGDPLHRRASGHRRTRASACLTYGRDAAGRPRWDPQLDHSCTTAVCGIHRQGNRRTLRPARSPERCNGDRGGSAVRSGAGGCNGASGPGTTTCVSPRSQRNRPTETKLAS